NRGIGAAIAERFAQAGDRVVVGHRTSAPADFSQRIVSVNIDVTDSQTLDEAFALIEKEIGPVEVLIANAGITRDNLILRMSDEDFDEVNETNFGGAFKCAKRAAKGMLKLKRGRLIFIGSVVGLLGSAGQSNYAATKSGLIGLARSLARELGSRSITANVIAPGFVETDMTHALSDERKSQIAAAIPLGRFAIADEIAGVAFFLASSDAGYISGAVIPVDGGLGMGH
ncbi:MAG: SDR family oxidoreductase, partial [Actinobacteria bacterium]|nr:SDR family oxidoreductase [Actinomycetota bacterium]